MGIGQTWYEDIEKKKRWRLEKHDNVKWEFGESSILRYVEQTDSRPLELAAAYIKTLSSFTNPDAEGVAITGTFVTKAVWWGKVQDVNGKSAFRLYHFLISDAVEGGDDAVVVEDGCRYKVTYTFYYRQSALTPPTTSTSGVGYKLIGITRDDISGLFSYILEKRERITQSILQWTSAEDVYKKDEKRVHLGVRDDDLDDEGVAVDLDTVGNPSDGILVEEERTKNEDCTHNIEQRKRTATAVSSAKIVQENTVFATRTVDTDVAQTDPLGAPSEASAGVTTRNTDTKREDGLYDTEQDIETTNEVSDVDKSIAKDIFGTETITKDRTMKEALGEAPAASGGLSTTHRDIKNANGTYEREKIEQQENEVTDAVKEEAQDALVTTTTTTDRSQTEALTTAGNPSAKTLIDTRSEKTKGGWYNNIERTRVFKNVTNAVRSYVNTIFKDTSSATEYAATFPHESAPAASEGVITRNESKLRPDGSYDNTATTEQENAVSNSVEETRKTAFNTRTVVENANQKAALTPASTDGVTTRSEKTPGGLYNQRTTTDTPKASVEGATSTLREHLRNVVTTITRNAPSKLTEPSADVDGVSKTVQNTLTEEGNYDTTEAVDTAIKRTNTFNVIDNDGTYRIHLLENYTKTEIDNYLSSTLVSTYENSASIQSTKYHNRFTTIIREKNPGGVTSLDTKMKYALSAQEETQVRIVYGRDGQVYKDTYTIWYDIKRNIGIADGREEYGSEGGFNSRTTSPLIGWGSAFYDLGRDWYLYKYVYAVSRISRTDITAAWTTDTGVFLHGS